MITIAGIADTHAAHNEVHPPMADILVVAGDILGHGEVRELGAFNEWLGTLPHKHKIVVGGNHDWALLDNVRAARAILWRAIYLDTEAVEVMGIKFFGCPWTPDFYDWAFMYPRGGERAKAIWNQVPEDTNVLVTHGPPAGLTLGRTRACFNHGTEDAGCVDQRNRIEQLPLLRATFCGHIHPGAGIDYIGKVACHNVAVVDDHYRVVRHGLVYEYK